MALSGGGGGTGGDGEGTSCLKSPPLPGQLLQVPGESSCGGRGQLDGNGTQPPAHQEEVGEADSGTDQEGSGCPDIGVDLIIGGTIGPDIQVRDMGPFTAYAEGAGRILP